MGFRNNSADNKHRSASVLLTVISLLAVLGYFAYEHLDVKVQAKIASMRDPLRSEYVKIIPASYGTSGKQVRVYGTQQCFRGPVTRVRFELESKGYVFDMYDLNANPKFHRTFQSLLAVTGSSKFVLPAYIVHDRMIYDNDDIVEQIRAVVEAQPAQTPLPQGAN